MYLYFDTQGNLKEQINDQALRQGNSNINKLYVYWEKSEDNANITGLWARFKADDGTYNPSSSTWIQSNTSVQETIPYDKNRDLKFFNYFKTYKFYTITIPDGVLGQSGAWLGTLQFVETDSITTLGQLAFYVSESNASVEADENINIAQWNYLIALISSTINSIPTKTSDLTNDSGFITNEDLSDDYVTTDTNQEISGEKTFTKKIKLQNSSHDDYEVSIETPSYPDNEVSIIVTDGTHSTEVHLPEFDDTADKQVTLATTDDLPTKVSDLNNDSGYQTQTQVETAINNAIASVYKVKGSGSVSSINASLALVTDKASWNGYVYNLIDSGNLTNYSGTTSVNAGDNVVFVYTSGINWGWDKLASDIDLSNYATKSEIPTKTSDLINNSGFVTQTDVNNASGNNYTIAYNLVVNNNGYQFNSYKFADVTLQSYPDYEIKQFQVSTTSAVVTDLSVIRNYLQTMTGHDRIPTYDEDRPINEFIICTSNDTMWKLQYDTTNGLLAFKVGSTPAVFSAKDVAYLTTAPSSANTSGKLKFVVLDSEPATYYDGYYYIITASATQTYSGNIESSLTNTNSIFTTKVKFDTAPTSANDYDFVSSLTPNTTYSNRTKIYIWSDNPNGGVTINNVFTSAGSGHATYDTAVELDLTGDYTIYVSYGQGGGGSN